MLSLNKDCAFESNRLVYRGIKDSDADLLVEWRSRQDVYKYSRQPYPITKEDHIIWSENYFNNPSELRVIVTEILSGADIGIVGGRCNGVCVLSFYIAESGYRNKGYMSEAIQAFIKYVSDQGNINDFEAHIHRDNSASICCVSKIGFIYDRISLDYAVYKFRSK